MQSWWDKLVPHAGISSATQISQGDPYNACASVIIVTVIKTTSRPLVHRVLAGVHPSGTPRHLQT